MHPDNSSTNQPDMQYVERVKGVEPSSLAWEAKVMPLYDTRLILKQAKFYIRTISNCSCV
jgi:hypothetical protein